MPAERNVVVIETAEMTQDEFERLLETISARRNGYEAYHKTKFSTDGPVEELARDPFVSPMPDIS